MKKICVSLITVLILIFIIACIFNSGTSTVKNGTYVLEKTGTNAVVVPRVVVSKEQIAFIYDSLSSYLPIGTYKIAGNKLTMTTDDGKLKYIFLIDRDKLIFQKGESSEVNLIDDRFGVKITDNAKFELK